MPEIPKGLVQPDPPAKKKVTLIGKDIRYIHERPKQSSSYEKLVDGFLIVINLLMTIGCIWGVGRSWQETQLGGNVALKREKAARKTAERSFRKLQQILKKDGSNRALFFDEAERMMNQYLADKLNLSPSGLTQQIILQRLTDRGVSRETVERIHRFYDVCGFVRFGKLEQFDSSAAEILKLAASILKETW